MSAEANRALTQTGVFKPQINFKVIVGYCAWIHNTMIIQLGLMDKNDLAWRYVKYDRLVDMLRGEFEIQNRISQLQEKINVVAKDASTFVSLQQHDRSTMLEWAVIVLIGIEIVVSLVDMGMKVTGGH